MTSDNKWDFCGPFLTKHSTHNSDGTLALTTGLGQVVYPAWQFTEEGSLVPGVAECLALLPADQVDPWLVASWFCSPINPHQPKTPIVLLLAGQREFVIAEAKEFARALEIRLAVHQRSSVTNKRSPSFGSGFSN